MTELEKMQRAKMYIDKMANGINPIDDTPAADSDILSVLHPVTSAFSGRNPDNCQDTW